MGIMGNLDFENLGYSQTYNLFDMYADGKSKGEIIIYFGHRTNTGEIKFASFSEDLNNLNLEIWKGQYGPLQYYLTRVE